MILKTILAKAMKISIYGAGYVGLISGICFAELGHEVCCVDINKEKILQLEKGKLPIYEENLEALLQKNLDLGRIYFTDNFQQAVSHAVVQIIAVGTPSKENGSADLQYVEAVAKRIGELMTDYRCIVNKSTVPVGTTKLVQLIISKKLNERNNNIQFDVVSNPEFLREGCAVKDCLMPDRIIIGAQSQKAILLMKELYLPLTQKKYSLIMMDPASAELTKYAANAFLAMKISFINEISQIAERTGANIHQIKRGIGSDSRINEKFLNAGCGFGGSCLPKDVLALKNISLEHGYKPHILNAVLRINNQQQQLLFQKISSYFNQKLSGKTIALWGLAFKPNTDDIRSASSRALIEKLLQANVIAQAYDPMAMNNIAYEYRAQKNLILCETAEHALKNADALAVITEWDEFKNPDFNKIKNSLKSPVIFDGRNIYDPQLVQKCGLEYFSIGCVHANQLYNPISKNAIIKNEDDC